MYSYSALILCQILDSPNKLSLRNLKPKDGPMGRQKRAITKDLMRYTGVQNLQTHKDGSRVLDLQSFLTAWLTGIVEVYALNSKDG